MKTKLITIENNDYSPLDEAAEIIKAGGLVALPTETVYGLGANALNAEACRHIFEAKGRPGDNPLIVHIADFDSLEKYTNITDNADKELAMKLALAFMPGPLTMVLPKASVIPDEVTAGLATVAIRFPAHPVAAELIKRSGLPIAAPSANISGSPSPTCAAHVVKDLDGKIDAIVDGGQCQIGLESTIIMPHGGVIRLLRPGAVTREQLSEFAKVEVDKAITGKLADGDKPLAPGMKYRHYAPHAPVVTVVGDDEAVCEFFKRKLKEPRTAVLCFEEQKKMLDSEENVFSLGHRERLDEQANLLFTRLREIDEGDYKIAYAVEPCRSGLGFAVYNRLIKACGFEVIAL